MTTQTQVSEMFPPSETGKMLKTTPGTLAVWRSTKRYPLRFVRIGRKIMYRLEDIQAFIELRTQSGVAEPVRDRSRKAR